ncbi:MAG: DegT/DnrJ/EryC1/StrS family aminotransferase [Ruminiclostridium sp.]|nr:DegT/DnrJ/EryC1/StrS family aminotransferase [Ruminiclostridium sp.]
MGLLAINGGPKIAGELNKARWPRLYPQDETAVLDALRKGYWGGFGDSNLPNRIFEREFSKYHDARYGVAVANGTVSLELSLKAAGVRPGDEVLVSAITFIASASAIVSVGAVPVFVDVDSDTCQISAKAIEASITSRTRGVVVVHYAGYMADMDAILPIAEKYGLVVIEDCAHAQGSAWRGRKAGSWGTFGSFSFQNSKALSAGEGGVVLTNDEKLYERAFLIMNIGRRLGQTSYDHYMASSNWRMGGLQAALLLSQFGRFPQEAEERNRNGAYLARELNKIPGIRSLPIDERITQRGYYYMLLDFNAEAFGCSREKFVEALRAEGVANVYYGYNRPLYKEPAFAQENLRPLLHESIKLPDYNGMYLPDAERWAACQVTILHNYLLGDGTEVNLILEAVRKVKENVSELAMV